MIFDDAAWHYNGDYPAGMPAVAAATHIGLFVAWAQLNGLGAQRHDGARADLQGRVVMPGAWFLANCGEQLTDLDLSDEGNRFATDYYLYDEDRHEDGDPSYLPDYAKSFPDAENAYSVADTWESYDRLGPLLAARFAMWQGRNRSKGTEDGL